MAALALAAAGPLFARSERTIYGELNRWSGDSGRRSGYAEHYEFTLRRASRVTILMGSDDFDTYLYLLSPDGSVIASNDDGGAGTDSCIRTRLGAGTYVVEATAWGVLSTGRYTLTLPGRPAAAAKTVHGELTRRSEPSTRRSGLAEWFRFTLPETMRVTIRMESSEFDTYLYVLSLDGRVLEFDDDGGWGTDSEIRTTLEAGTYTIEATSWWAGETGAFTLALDTDRPLR